MCGNNNNNNNNNNNLHAGTPKLQYFYLRVPDYKTLVVVVIRSYMVLEKSNLNLIMTINACGHE